MITVREEHARWITVALLFVVGAMNYADRTIVSVVLPLIRADLHLSDFQLGSMGVFFLWTYAACMPLAGWAGDRFSRSRIITVSFLAWSAITIATAFVRTLPEFYATRVMMGISESFYIPAAIALIAGRHSPSTRGTAMAIHLAGINLGLVAGGTMGGYVGQHYGWRPTFLVFGLLGILFSGVTACWLRDPNHRQIKASDRPPFGRAFRQLASYPTFWVQLAQAMCLAVGVWIFLNWLPLYFTESFGASLSNSGFVGTFMPQFSSVLGILAGGWLSDRIARHNLRYRILAQAGFYFAAAPPLLAFLWQPPFSGASAIVFGSSFLRATGQANEDPILCDVLPDRIRATAIAMMNAGQCFTGGLGVLLAGLLKSRYGLQGTFVGIAGMIALAGVICSVGYLRALPADLRKRETQYESCL